MGNSLISCVFSLVCVVGGNTADIAGLKIECSRRLGGGEACDSSVACKEEIPFVGGKMPMDLSHCTCFHREEPHGEILCYRPDCWIDNSEVAAGDL